MLSPKTAYLVVKQQKYADIIIISYLQNGIYVILIISNWDPWIITQLLLDNEIFTVPDGWWLDYFNSLEVISHQTWRRKKESWSPAAGQTARGRRLEHIADSQRTGIKTLLPLALSFQQDTTVMSYWREYIIYSLQKLFDSTAEQNSVDDVGDEEREEHEDVRDPLVDHFRCEKRK